MTIIRKLGIQFKEDDGSLFAIVHEEGLNPTIVGAISATAISSDSLLEIEFKGIILSHIRRVAENQNWSVEEITLEKKDPNAST